VVLTRNLPNLGLRTGDFGTVVLVHQGGRGFEVEFVSAGGDTRAVTTLATADVTAVDQADRAGLSGENR